MRASTTLFGVLLALLALATPAHAMEDGIVDTSSFTPNEDFTHADFERVITNVSEGPIDVAPRNLAMVEYPTMTVTEITAGAFDGGVWTVGTLEAGQTATIAYSGDAAPPTTAALAAVSSTTAPEELPHTGQRGHLVTFAISGIALIGLGASALRATRD